MNELDGLFGSTFASLFYGASNSYNYNYYVTPSAASNWGTAPVTQPWNSSLGLSGMDYAGSALSGFTAELSNILAMLPSFLIS